MIGITEDTIVIILGVYNRLLAHRVARTIRASVVLEIRCVIYVENPDISRDYVPLCLRVIVLLEVTHNISLTLNQPRIRKVCRQGVLHLLLGVKWLLQVREVKPVDLILRLEFLL